MSRPIVLVAFASQRGSTAAIADVVAGELRANGIEVDCRPASDVVSVAAYATVVLGSGVFVRGRATDGGGFLARHAEALAGRALWLFCAGPIGHGTPRDGAAGECAVLQVARTIGARGAEAFGSPCVEDACPDAPPTVDVPRIRAWARVIAVDVVRASYAAAS